MLGFGVPGRPVNPLPFIFFFLFSLIFLESSTMQIMVAGAVPALQNYKDLAKQLSLLVTDSVGNRLSSVLKIQVMYNLLSYPPVTELLLSEVVRCITSVGSPQKIVLFGSRARGDARADSDLDLLIIEDSERPRYRRSARYRRALCGVFPAKDIVVWTPEEVEEWREVPNAFITTVLAEGKVLYEK